jgi:soluble lytic murein transglycosylase-like protein
MLTVLPQLPPGSTPRRFILPLSALAMLLLGYGLKLTPAQVVYSPAKNIISALSKAAGGLHVLSASDIQYYHDAFAFQQEKHFAEADAALARVDDVILKDALLSARAATNETKAVSEAAAQALKAASSGYERSDLRNNEGGHWSAGLNSYRNHDMAAAATHFRALLKPDNDLSGDDRAAAAYWAYRSLQAAGDSKTAMEYAEVAAAETPSFYSILARNVTGQEMKTDDAASLEMVSPLLAQDAVRRAIAFKEIGQDAHAEAELHNFFSASNDADKKRLITLARLLDLPAAQMRMALAYAQGSDEGGDGLYPMPRWTPTAGYRVEPALLFAIMRQESGFNPNARSAAGAMGVMQLMPATAHAMAREEHILGRSSMPSVSMTLGQSYLERLMDTSLIGDNLLFLTAAYNAGPGTVANWKHNLHYNNDPLLFVESIPYSETREYVLHVVGNYWVYSRLLGNNEDASVAALSAGVWPRYAGSQKQLTSMLSRLGNDRIE